MGQALPKEMRAAAADQFGGLEKLTVRSVPLPGIGPDEILIKVEAAGVGVWDPFELEGGFAEMFHIKPSFPYVPGADGAGTVVAVGERVTKFREGQKVYGFGNLKGRGFYAEYVAVNADEASPIPGGLTTEQAGAMPIDAITALQGLDDSLHLKQGELLMIFGASGGIGHIAVQLAKRMGARVFAVASGTDGVELVKKLGADMVVDGHKDDLPAAARKFAPQGLDAALLTAGGEAAEKALAAMRSGARIAYPHGVEPEPRTLSDIKVTRYSAMPNPQAIQKLNNLIERGPFEVHIAKKFTLEQAAAVGQALGSHFVGKMEIQPSM